MLHWINNFIHSIYPRKGELCQCINLMVSGPSQCAQHISNQICKWLDSWMKATCFCYLYCVNIVMCITHYSYITVHTIDSIYWQPYTVTFTFTASPISDLPAKDSTWKIQLHKVNSCSVTYFDRVCILILIGLICERPGTLMKVVSDKK